MVRSFFPHIALLLTEGVSSADCLKLPPSFETTFSMLKNPTGRRRLSRVIDKPIPDIPWEKFDKQIEAIDRHGVEVVTHLDGRYPDYLRSIPMSPAVLFYKGDVGMLARRGVAVVGTRAATIKSCAFARSLASELSGMNIMVASGVARGIDTAAHIGALDGKGGTVGILGAGIDNPFPPENAGLMDEIASRGLLVSEQLMGTPPLRHVFPLRNRLISGVSRVVVVVEAGERSGALITAKWALEQGRDVGAVPAFPGDPRCRGANALLKAGAFAVEGASDVVEAVPLLLSHESGLRLKPDAAAPADAAVKAVPKGGGEVLDAMGVEGADADMIAAHLQKPVAGIQQILLELEIHGFIGRDNAGSYYRI